jgi:hypothetical protein
MGLPDLVWSVGFLFISSFVISTRLGTNDTFILLQALKSLKNSGATKLTSPLISYFIF